MKCQFCNKKEADKLFYVNWMGIQYQIAICADCLEQMWQRANAAGQEEAFRQYAGWWPGKPEPRQWGEHPFPAEAEEGLRKRRMLLTMQMRLRRAEESEHYEEAARLRDEIAALGGVCHEN